MGDDSLRLERIERLLRDLEYEVTRGIMEREIEPRMYFGRVLPGSPTGYVSLIFEVRPSDGHFPSGADVRPRLRVVKDGG